MTRRELEAALAAARTEAARRCGLSEYPLEIIRLSEKLDRAITGKPSRATLAHHRVMEARRQLLAAELRRPT